LFNPKYVPTLKIKKKKKKMEERVVSEQAPPAEMKKEKPDRIPLPEDLNKEKKQIVKKKQNPKEIKEQIRQVSEFEKIVPKILAISNNRTDTRIYVRGDRAINYGRVLEIMGRLSGAGFSKVALISEPYKN